MPRLAGQILSDSAGATDWPPRLFVVAPEAVKPLAGVCTQPGKGLDRLHRIVRHPVSQREEGRRDWTKAKVLKEIRAWKRKGHHMNYRAFKQDYQALLQLAKKFFGSWDRARTAAGA